MTSHSFIEASVSAWLWGADIGSEADDAVDGEKEAMRPLLEFDRTNVEGAATVEMEAERLTVIETTMELPAPLTTELPPPLTSTGPLDRAVADGALTLAVKLPPDGVATPARGVMLTLAVRLPPDGVATPARGVILTGTDPVREDLGVKLANGSNSTGVARTPTVRGRGGVKPLLTSLPV